MTNLFTTKTDETNTKHTDKPQPGWSVIDHAPLSDKLVMAVMHFINISQVLQFYSNGSGLCSYIIRLCNLYMTLLDHISLEQMQGMIENKREATTPSFVID